jgi:hypothetical protein
MERSEEIIRSLDPEQVGDMSVGRVVYENDWLTRHALGGAIVGSEVIHLGIELPKRLRATQELFVNTLRQISHMVAEAPDLLPHVPSFVGAVTSAEDQPYQAKGVLVEDVTEGGRYTLEPRPVSDELRQKSVHLGIELSRSDALVAAEVAGQERIVNFAPAPLRMTFEEHEELGRQVSRAQRALTVVIAADSVLAADLTRGR